MEKTYLDLVIGNGKNQNFIEEEKDSEDSEYNVVITPNKSGFCQDNIMSDEIWYEYNKIWYVSIISSLFFLFKNLSEFVSCFGKERQHLVGKFFLFFLLLFLDILIGKFDRFIIINEPFISEYKSNQFEQYLY